MATTPNFNWSTPDNTGLVKNGALDIRTLGNSIDASMAELKGGTTGQVLSKTSNTDMDFTWVAQDDSNAIQNAIVDAKGDLIAASASDTPARLAVGANGTSLVADSTQTTGLKWGYATDLGVNLANGDQSVANASTVILTWGTEFWDVGGYHSTTTNPSRVTIPAGLGGKYLLTGFLVFPANAVGSRFAGIKVNGGTDNFLQSGDGNATYSTYVNYSCIFELVAGDYFEVIAFQNSGGSLNALSISRAQLTYLGA
jgi:hypothetical protein